MYLLISKGLPIGLLTSLADAANMSKNLNEFKISQLFPNSDIVNLLSEKKATRN